MCTNIFNFDKEQTAKLVNARYKNANMHWNMLKDCAHVKQNNIPLSIFVQYFKTVNKLKTVKYRYT